MSVKDITSEFSQIPNAVLDAVMRPELDSYDRIVLLYIVRKTYGFNCDFDEISLSQFVKDLGFSKSRVIKSHKKLESLGDIFIHRYKDQKRVQHNIFFMATNTSIGIIESLESGAIDPKGLKFHKRLISGENIKQRRENQSINNDFGGSAPERQGVSSAKTGVVCDKDRGSAHGVHTKDNLLKTLFKDTNIKMEKSSEKKKTKADLKKEWDQLSREHFKQQWAIYPSRLKEREALNHYLAHMNGLNAEERTLIHNQSMRNIRIYVAYVILNDIPKKFAFRGYNYFKNAMWKEIEAQSEIPKALKEIIISSPIKSVKEIVGDYLDRESKATGANSKSSELTTDEKQGISVICNKTGTNYLKVIREMQNKKMAYIENPDAFSQEQPGMVRFFEDPIKYSESYLS